MHQDHFEYGAGMNRRDFLSQLPLLAGGIMIAPRLLGQQPAVGTAVAKTTHGKVQGAVQNGVLVFKGIPYAGSPAGEGRFKPAPPLQPWTGVRDALAYGPQSIQPPDPGWPKEWKPAASDEMCQYLNIWTQGLADGRRRPIMFYSHGGGFATGNGGADIWPQNLFHDGSALASSYDVVVVTHNHRLGILGYLYLADLLGEEYATSGCVGMLDIQAAMEWVRNNAEAFGGDPDNIMIWGESGGGAKTTTLVAMPGAHGMFQKASIESGAVLRLQTKDAAMESTRTVLAKLGLSEKQARELLKIPADRLRDLQQSMSAGTPSANRGARMAAPGGAMFGFGPVVDGHTIPNHPFDPVAPPFSKNIPIMVGGNKDETIMMFQRGDLAVFSLDEAGLRKRLTDGFGDQAGRILEVYRKNRPNASPADLYIAITTAQWMGKNVTTLAERKVAQNGAPVFVYEFAYESEVPVAPGVNYPTKSPHAMEIGFKFNHPDNILNAGKRPERFKAARNMSRAWASFARNSNPSHDEIPPWPAYTLEQRATMILDTECKVVNDLNREERLLWEQLG
jgi:para-nitrobenzyl esterase